MNSLPQLNRLAKTIVRTALQQKKRFVLTESCTGGLPSHLLTSIPGVSEIFCGSSVSYRIDSKARWLKVPRGVISKKGVVSQEVAEYMAIGILRQTPEADFAVSSTGHLGPNAPINLDGRVYFGLASRNAKSPGTLPKGSQWSKRGPFWVTSSMLQLPPPSTRSHEKARKERIALASLSMLRMVRSLL